MIGLTYSFTWTGIFSQALICHWVSTGCVNGIAGLVNTQRDRTHIILHMDGVSGGGPIGRDFASEAISRMRQHICYALRGIMDRRWRRATKLQRSRAERHQKCRSCLKYRRGLLPKGTAVSPGELNPAGLSSCESDHAKCGGLY